MDRCDYCGRILHINRSDKYFLCSKKCKQKFKNKSDILNTNKFVLNLVSKEWISVNDIVLSNTNKFEIVSSISRLIYFEKKFINYRPWNWCRFTRGDLIYFWVFKYIVD